MGRRPQTLGALATAVVAGEGALALLRPREGVVPPRPVDVTGYFSRAEIDRARAFRRPQLALGLAGGAARLALLTAAWRHARVAGPAPERGGRAVAEAGVAGAVLAVGSRAVGLPFSALARRRALDAGLATDRWGAWARDVAKATGIGAGLSGAASAGSIALLRAVPRRWWLPASALTVGVSAAGAMLAPVLLDPVFNAFTPLEGEPREAVLGLAGAAGVHVGAVLAVDASRRTSAANAYVTGLGRTKRVVLFDTLLDRYPPDERDLVIAHELAHVRHRDVPRQIAFLALTAPATMYATQALAERLDVHGLGAGRATARSLPALALAAGAAMATTTQATLRLSRTVENRADAYALSLHPAYDAFVGFERRIALQNLADPDPPRVLQALLGTHPTTVQRIGIAEALRSRDEVSPRRAPAAPRPPAGS